MLMLLATRTKMLGWEFALFLFSLSLLSLFRAFARKKNPIHTKNQRAHSKPCQNGTCLSKMQLITKLITHKKKLKKKTI